MNQTNQSSPTSATTTTALPQPAPEIMMEGITTALKLLSDRYQGYYDPPNAIRNHISRSFKNLFPEQDTAVINSIIYNDGDDTSTINDLHQGYDLSIAYVDQYMRLAKLECTQIKRQLQKKKLSLNRIIEEKRKALEDEAKYNAGAEERERQVLIRIQKMPDDIIRVIATYAYTPAIRCLILELKYDFSELLPKLKITVKQMKALYYRFKQVNEPIAKGLDIYNRREIYGTTNFGSVWVSMSKNDENMSKKEQFIAKMLLMMNKLKTLSESTARYHNKKKTYRLLSNGLLANYKLITYVLKRFAPVPQAIAPAKITKKRKPRTSKQVAVPLEVIDLTNITP